MHDSEGTVGLVESEEETVFMSSPVIVGKLSRNPWKYSIILCLCEIEVN